MTGVTLRLGLVQTLGWASSYYLAAILGEGMAASLSVPLSTMYAVVSLALVVCALVGPAAGKWVDRYGGRAVLCTSSIVFCAGLALMSQASHMAVFVVALLLAAGGPAMAPVFGLMHGAGNGILTVSKGTLPLALFGSAGYGQRLGWLMLPGRLAQAAAPLGFGLAMDGMGGGAIWLSTGLTALSLLALLLLRRPERPPD